MFAVALLPLAALAAARSGLRLACVTLVIVVLVTGGGGSPFERPLHRGFEILIGAAGTGVHTPRVDPAWRALPEALCSLADAIAAMPVNQSKLQEAHSLLEPVQKHIDTHPDEGREMLAPGVSLVVALIVKDTEGLTHMLFPSRESSDS